MSFVTDRMDLGYFPLQDYAATTDGTPPGKRQCLAGVRLATLKDAKQIVDRDSGFIEIAREDGMGTLGDIHPWYFWQTRERTKRAMGSWTQAMASVVIDHDIYYGESRTQPIRDAFMRNDTRYKSRVSYIAAGLPELPGGAMVLTMAGTTEEMQHPITMWADPRLVCPNTGGRAETGTLVVDTTDEGELCMGGSAVPGVGGRSARLQSLMRVIPVFPGATLGGLGGLDGNVLALNYGQSGIDALSGYGAVHGFLQGYDGPTTGSGGGHSSGGSGGSAQAQYSGNGSPSRSSTTRSASSDERGRFSYSTNNGGGGFGSFFSSGEDEEKAPRDYGPFEPKVGPTGTALMAALGAYGPIHLGTATDKHRLGTDADGKVVNSAHISTNAYYFASNYADGPLEFSGTPYPRGAIKSYPGAAPVHLSFDIATMHAHKTGNKQGKWRWWAEVPYLVPGPSTGGPSTGGPNPGGGHPGGPGPGGPTTPGGGGRGPRPGPGPTPGPGGPSTPGPGGGPAGGQGGGKPGTGGAGGAAGGSPSTPSGGGFLPPYVPPLFPEPFEYKPSLEPLWPKGTAGPMGPVRGPTTPGPSDKGGKTFPQGGGSVPGDGEPGGPQVDPGDGYNPDQPYGGPSTPGPGPGPGGGTGKGPNSGGGICNQSDTNGLLVKQGEQAQRNSYAGDEQNNPSRMLQAGYGDRTVQIGWRPRSNRFTGTRRKDPRETLGRWSGRNPWTREVERVPGVVDHVGGAGDEARNLYSIFHPLHESFAALSFRPQLWVQRYPHFERNPQVGYEMLERDEVRRPQVLALRAWGAQDQDAGDWSYKEPAANSRSRGGTANGGLMFAPPRFEGEDYFGIRSAADVEDVTSDKATRSYVLATPGVSFALGRPDLSGGLKTGGITITQAKPTADRALLIEQDGSELVRAYDNGDVIVELAQGGTGAIVIPQGTTAQRPTASAGMLRVRTGGINDILEVYDAANSVWRACSPDGTAAPTVDIAEGGTGATTVDGAVENLYLNIAWDHLLPHDQSGAWTKNTASGGQIYQGNQGSYSWCQTADVQGILVVSSDAGTSASTGAALNHNNLIAYAATDSTFYFRVSTNYNNGAKFRWGLTRLALGATGDVTDGAYFEYDVGVSANIYACTAAASTRTKVDTGQNISSVLQTWRTFAIKKTASGFAFYDLDTSTSTPLATITTNIPSAANLAVRGFVQSIYNGNTYRSVFLDAFGTQIATGWFPGSPS